MIQTSNRERIALELAEKASQRYRDKKQKTIEVAKSYLASYVYIVYLFQKSKRMQNQYAVGVINVC